MQRIAVLASGVLAGILAGGVPTAGAAGEWGLNGTYVATSNKPPQQLDDQHDLQHSGRKLTSASTAASTS